jgi:hypothetical protein
VGGQLDAQGKRALIEKYLEFRQLMLKPALKKPKRDRLRLDRLYGLSIYGSRLNRPFPIFFIVSSVAPMMGAPLVVGTTTATMGGSETVLRGGGGHGPPDPSMIATTPSKSRKSSKGVR